MALSAKQKKNIALAMLRELDNVMGEAYEDVMDAAGIDEEDGDAADRYANKLMSYWRKNIIK